MDKKFTLNQIFSNPSEYISHLDSSQQEQEPVPEQNKPIAGLCCECEDQPRNLKCLDCDDYYCSVCYAFLHRKSKRRNHKVEQLDNHNGVSNGVIPATAEEEDVQVDELSLDTIVTSSDDISERAKYIPLRLSQKERKVLRLLEAALNVSEYTDKVDIYHSSSKSKRIVEQIKDVCGVLCGLVVSCDYDTGKELIEDKEFKDNEKFFRRVFEVGRRYKILNPERMRDSYGKMIYLLMDSMIPEIQGLLEFQLVSPLVSVHQYLGDRKCELLSDLLVNIATSEIYPTGKGRRQVQKEIKQKDLAIETLAKKYESNEISKDEIKTCLYSIGDNSAFLRQNRDPIDKILEYLKKYFNPSVNNPSLAIQSGDHNVPNALMFIDKYTQVSRILQPIVLVIESLPSLTNHSIMKYIEHEFGSIDKLRIEILQDFFRSGFDGSGADNFFDAGSCIDGRLTSAWNWCNGIEKKRFYKVFLVCGFVGFDGQF